MKKALRLTAFILAMVMLALFSVGTVLMTLKGVQNEKESEGIVQYRTSAPVAELKSFEITSPTIQEGEKLKIDVDADVDESYGIEYYGLWAKNNATGEVFYSTFDGPDLGENGQTNDGANNATPGTYTVTGLTAAIIPKDTPVGETTWYYINVDNCADDFDCNNANLLKGKTFTITEKQVEESPFYEYIIGFDVRDPKEANPTVSAGDKIKLGVKRVDANDEIKADRRSIKSVMLSFSNQNDGSVINMYVKNLYIADDSYIVIPSTATPGQYYLTYGYFTFMDGSTARYQNTANKTFSYETRFVVKEKEMDTSKYTFNNELYDNNIKSDLAKLDNDAIITVDANKNPIINEELFESIKGTKQTLIIDYDTSEWVFSATDIKNPKSVDVSTLVSKLESGNEYYDSFLKTNIKNPSAMLKFSDNGDLPGKVLIRIDKHSINTYLEDPKSVFVYYYKEDSDQLMKVAMEIQSNDNFYEFYINHNSKYIISSKEIKSKVVSDNLEMLSLNGQAIQSSQMPWIYILATSCGVLAMLLLIVSLSKGRKQSQQQTQES